MTVLPLPHACLEVGAGREYSTAAPGVLPWLIDRLIDLFNVQTYIKYLTGHLKLARSHPQIVVVCLAVVGQIFICCLPNTAVTASMDDRIYEMNDRIYEVREKTATGARPLLFSKDSKCSFICLVLPTWASTIVGRARQTTAFDISDVVH